MSAQLQKARPLVQVADGLISQQNIERARSLHPRLLRFFEKYPPSLYIGNQRPPVNACDNRRLPRNSKPAEILEELRAAKVDALHRARQRLLDLEQRRAAISERRAALAGEDGTPEQDIGEAETEVVVDEEEQTTLIASEPSHRTRIPLQSSLIAKPLEHLMDMQAYLQQELSEAPRDQLEQLQRQLSATIDATDKAREMMANMSLFSDQAMSQPSAMSSTATTTLDTPESPAPAPPQEVPYTFNPFLPTKNFRNGTWTSPLYSLRRQAELCKLARQHGVEDWLPWSRKLSWVKDERRFEQGLRMKGTGVGRRVKGHRWERSMPEKLERRKQAMLDMPRLVSEWKEKGHGRGLEQKKYPSGKAKK